MKKVNKTFTTIKSNISELKEDEYDLSDSYGESQADSFFLLKVNYQGVEPKYNTTEHNLLYNYRKKISIQNKLDLRTVVLLYNESNMDLFYNPDLVEDIKKINRPLRIQSNGGEMTVNNKAKIPRYNKRVWFSIRAITNIKALKILTEQYIVTYDRNEQMFIVHR